MRVFLDSICGRRRAIVACAWAMGLACCGAAVGQTQDELSAAAAFAESPGANAPLFNYRRDDDADAVAAANPLRPAAVQPAALPSADAPRYDGQFAAAEYAAAIDDDSYAAAAASPANAPPQAPAVEVALPEFEGETAPEPAAAPLTSAAAALPGTPVASAAHPTASVPPWEAATDFNASSDERRLAPPSPAWESQAAGTSASRRATAASLFARLKGLSSAGIGLAVVVGLLVACLCLTRKSGPKPGGALPHEAFAVLGRAPLTSQSFAQLLRVGNKLVLVAISADGAQPLTEVTDPAEVDRLAGICLGGRGGSSAEFQQVLAQLSREPARGFLGREGSAGRRR